MRPDQDWRPEDELGDDDTVEDQAALDAAERAVREAEDEQEALERADVPSNEPWVIVASAAAMDPGRSLEPLYEALREVRIPAAFDPYRPGVASNPYPTVQRAFHILVPQSREAEARDVLRAVRVDVPTSQAASRLPKGTERRRSRSRRIIAIVLALILVALVVQLVASLLYQWGVLHG